MEVMKFLVQIAVSEVDPIQLGFLIILSIVVKTLKMPKLLLMTVPGVNQEVKNILLDGIRKAGLK